MNKPTKLIKIGNSVGVILPKDVVARMRVALGEDIYISEGPRGVTLSPSDADFIDAMNAADEIMREDRDILAVLAR
jgi:putative addiction module antidote